MSNYQRTETWLAACGKTPSAKNLSVQIGCHIEEFMELLATLDFSSPAYDTALRESMMSLRHLSLNLKTGHASVRIREQQREEALDALCDCEVTGNGIAYLAGFDKVHADEAVLASNDAKLIDGKPVILEGGKIGKPEGWKAPDLSQFV
jgi:predicted HAD superfamily Cof-like phosphohydrolase